MQPESFRDISYSRDDAGIATLAFNTPRRKNALSALTFFEVRQAARTFEEDPDAHALILTGTPDPESDDVTREAFSSGGYFNPDAYEGVCGASPVSYHTLKGGILQMTRHLAVYWASDNIRVNSLSPGPFPARSAPEGLKERLVEKSPLRRMGLPHELKGALLLLASDAGSYITGHDLVVDGGWTSW